MLYKTMDIHTTEAWADPHNQPCPICGLLPTFVRDGSGDLEGWLAHDVHFYLAGGGDWDREASGLEAVAELIRSRRAMRAGVPYDVTVLSVSESTHHVAVRAAVRAWVAGQEFRWRCVWVCLLWLGHITTFALYVDERDQAAYGHFLDLTARDRWPAG
jgi:hypothetical protein